MARRIMAQVTEERLREAIASNIQPQSYKNGGRYIELTQNNKTTKHKLIDDKNQPTKLGEKYYNLFKYSNTKYY